MMSTLPVMEDDFELAWKRENAKQPSSGPSSQKSTTLALVDQAVISAASFITIVLLGRYAGTESLGIFSLCFSLLMLVLCLQRALIITPYTLIGHQGCEDDRSRMRGSARAQTVALSSLVFFVGSLTWLSIEVWGTAVAADVAFALFFAFPAVMMKDYFRAIAIADLRVGEAIWIDGSTAAIQIAGMAIMGWNGALTASGSLWILCGSHACIGLLFCFLSRPKHMWCQLDAMESVKRSWGVGRWLMLSQVAHAAQSYSLHWTVAFTLGFGASGVLAACWSTVQIVSPFVQGMGNAFEPQIARAYASSGIAGLERFAKRAGLLMSTAMLIYFIGIAIFGGEILARLYGDEFAQHHRLTTLLAAGAAILAAGMVAGKGLVVLGCSRTVFWINFAGLVASITITFLLVFNLGAVAAGIGVLVGGTLSSVLRHAIFLSQLQSHRILAENA